MNGALWTIIDCSGISNHYFDTSYPTQWPDTNIRNCCPVKLQEIWQIDRIVVFVTLVRWKREIIYENWAGTSIRNFFPKIINYKAKIDQTLSVKVCLVKNQNIIIWPGISIRNITDTLPSEKIFLIIRHNDRKLVYVTILSGEICQKLSLSRK